MARNFDDAVMSELEREFELEMDEFIGQSGKEDAFEAEFEALLEADEPGSAYEFEADDEYEVSGEEFPDYANRFYELSLREFESEAEADDAVNGLLSEMEREYFFGAIKNVFNKAKRAAKKISRSPLGGLLKKGFTLAKGQFPALQALNGITQLARGNLKGLLGSLAKAGLGAALPGAGPFLPAALKALGFEATGEPGVNREAWNNFVNVAQEAYENLANNLNERADDPLEASRLATAAFQQALRGVQNGSRPVDQGGALSPRRIIQLKPGEEVIIRVSQR